MLCPCISLDVLNDFFVLLIISLFGRAMNPGIALLAVSTSVTIFLCLSALGAADAADSDFLFGAERGQRHLLSGYKTVDRDSESSLRATATVDTTNAMNIAAAGAGASCSKCQWQ